jgi:hypothetical protein
MGERCWSCFRSGSHVVYHVMGIRSNTIVLESAYSRLSLSPLIDSVGIG